MSHFSNIGFIIENEGSLLELCQKVFKKSQKIKVSNGTYFRYTDESGAELWMQENRKKELVGVNPHFNGKSKRFVRLENKYTKNDTTLDGYLSCWAESTRESNSDSGLYPFVFDSPDFYTIGDIDFPKIFEIQLAAFSHEIKLFINENDFVKNSKGKMAVKSFIPSGLFDPGGKEKNPPQALGIFTGVVKEAEVKKNHISNQNFYWILVDTYGGEVDVLADINSLPKEPKTGNIVSGQFWLSGRLINTPYQKKAGVFRKFLGN